MRTEDFHLKSLINTSSALILFLSVRTISRLKAESYETGNRSSVLEVRGFCRGMENGYVDNMEARLRCGSLRQKSKVPRACCSQRSDYVDPSNGSLRKDSPMSGGSSLQLSDTDEHKEWQKLVGERVCISGVKQGILRYFGRTNFAHGHWCGVELDEPVGKNNGTVNGVIYFNCKPNHGIFAPVSKVSKLNDLSSCNWQIDSREIMAAAQQQEARYRHPHWDYNLGLLADAESSEKKYIKNSISDPSFLRATMRATMPRCSESFPYDKRGFAEQQESIPMNFRNVRNFEIPDPSSRRSKSQSSSATVVKNTSRSLGKYGYNKKNQYLTSNGAFFEESGGDSLREKHASLRSAASGLQNAGLAATVEEYEQFLRTPTNSGEVSPLSSEVKRFSEMPLYDYGKIPDSLLNAFQPHDLSDFEDDAEDHMSVDYDESLGILTPSQMKDLTLGPDFPTSLSDIRGMDFPSSESFDDINDLPEDEQVHDVSVYRVSESSAVRNVEVSKPNNLGNYNSKSYSMSNEDKVHVSSTDKFLYSISQKDHDPYALETCFSSSSAEDFGRTFKINNLSAATTLCNDQHKINNVEKERYFEEKSLSKTSGGESTFGSNIHLIQNNTLLGASLSESDASSLGDQNKTEVDQNISTYHGGKPKSHALKNFAKEEICRKNYDTDDSRDSLQTESESNSTMKEKLTVSWEDCLSHNNDCMYSHVERPESVYTVGSNDTGFQEDGELEGMTTSIDSSDGNKRFSTTSRDSCIVSDEADAYKIAESNSTSGYSTGLSDSCCNDRAEDDLSSKPLTDEEIQDSVGPCDSEDAFSFQEGNSLSKDPEIMTMESSEITTEAVTALCNNDSASDALCETMVEDSTLTEIHDLLLSPEENRSPSSVDAKEMPVETPDDTDDAKTIEKKESDVSDSSPAQSTPEKKPTQTKAEVSRTVATRTTRTSRMCEEESDKKKQVTKSPKKNVMSKIKAMIEATSCKAAPKTKPEAIEPISRRAVSAPKKSRWEAVTSKIAASLAEEKTKPKTKREIKSRVDTNLTTARQQVTVCKSPKLDSSRLSNCDGSMSPISVSSRDRRPLTERNSTTSSLREARVKLSRDSKQRPKSPRPSGKACITSRSASPVAASESSSASLNSHSKIAQWKGSTSTVASSAPPPVIGSAKRPPPVASSAKATVPSARTTARVPNKKPPVPKIRVSAPSSTRMRSPSPAVPRTKHTKTTKGGWLIFSAFRGLQRVTS
ncbi:CAP-Gly domain-containing linker protein 1 [Nephila pilipes]|uniref:CAP-Gly domain-containing linker protein 1 n=1 Tax=Nephila pilipes TaxID=299642 RepID=A0A8X6TT93_NEPPI|nr:CAP-Gly domain-containing linker protein 1 [Nephila pilipes]